MQSFIGTKRIHAKPMDRADYNEFRGWELPADECGSDAGMLVEYTDGGKANTDSYTGYVSWSPLDVFNLAYTETNGMTFSEALSAIKLGESVALPFWGADVFISLQTPTELSKMTASYLFVTSRYGLVPWNPTQVELLANNWQVVDK